ncbi:hypothetical protein MYSTI_01930 [Myxococcus stipitatus DSM 14675]|uniref:DUF2190 family protein n=1 Tax=Myxococcus stipitatus (strain DSM 14675 / JCM 12634 / Mx s8) TaxID=1278073 RepID=L7U398_MYXSD|nr:DUF2190 family protein [Myxococcus stipitatus]AGC43261.1 hypothetical protein MYSTI_01930 [Myxococcus stipitatus DSM 14675]
MNNYSQLGETVTLTAPYAVSSGEGALVGSLFGVATGNVASGAEGEFLTCGVVVLKKTSAQAWTQGAKVYWDNAARECTTTASTNALIGCALSAAANPSATGAVRLNGAVA